ncbi:ubiquitin-like protein ATG12 [Ruditapes philippinarum]|uniref:ubiquitin-like protein ATG12 n=1 Tax=Ruditapes philippinarum TaxID=129788 RepID=UPI00295B328A|nr:ubiquitin-like protein ATG12 [Ruditapes philippinarum]
MSTSQNSEENPEVSHENKDEVHGASGNGGESSTPTSPTHAKFKVDVLLKPAGDAPIMKKKKWAVERNKKIVYISDFIKKFIRMGQNESIFLYVNQSFSPSPDTEVGCVFDCFGSDGKLVLHYCRTQAWG